MPAYKLTYFNGRGLGEAIRLIFHQADVPFEDFRMYVGDSICAVFPEAGAFANDPERQWSYIKPKTPTNQVPMLELDGKKLTQSKAIGRYLARQFRLAGKSDWEQAEADLVVDLVVDCDFVQLPLRDAKFSGDKAKLEKEWKHYKEGAVKKFLEVSTKLLSENKTGWFVGDSVTWADLVVADFVYDLVTYDAGVLEEYALIKQHQLKVFSLPNIAAYIAKRPETNWF